MPELAVIIVNYNTRDLLRACLTRLLPRVSPTDARVVVVDNASSDGSAELVRSEFPDVSLMVNAENVGFARANNRAIEATDSSYVLLLNSDAFLHSPSLHELRRTMECDSRIAVAGPRMYDANGTPLASAHGIETLTRLAATALGVHGFLPGPVTRGAGRLLGRAGALHRANYEADAVADVDWVSGACMMVRRSATAEVGLLDERYFMYMEDEDWCRRFKDAGYRVVYVPAAEVTHHVGTSSSSSARTARLHRASRLIYHRKHNARLYPLFWLLAQVYAARRCGPARVAHVRTVDPTQDSAAPASGEDER